MIAKKLSQLLIRQRRSTRSAITLSSTLNVLSNISQSVLIARDQRLDSVHQKPNKKATNTHTLGELNPSQPIGIKLKCSHHQIQNLLVLPHDKRTISRIELLNLLELDLTELGHLPRAY